MKCRCPQCSNKPEYLRQDVEPQYAALSPENPRAEICEAVRWSKMGIEGSNAAFTRTRYASQTKDDRPKRRDQLPAATHGNRNEWEGAVEIIDDLLTKLEPAFQISLRALVRRYPQFTSESDDILQTARMQVIKVHKKQPHLVSQRYWAKVIKHAMSEYVQLLANRMPAQSTQTDADFGSTNLAHEELEEIFACCADERERTLVEARLQGHDFREAGTMIGVSYSRATVIFTEIEKRYLARNPGAFDINARRASNQLHAPIPIVDFGAARRTPRPSKRKLT